VSLLQAIRKNFIGASTDQIYLVKDAAKAHKSAVSREQLRQMNFVDLETPAYTP